VELVTALLFAGIVWRYGLQPMTPLWCAFAAALLACAVIDFDHQIIPDEISLGGLVVALVLTPLLRAASGADPWSALAASVGGALLGGGLFWLVGFLHARISTALGRRFAHWPGPGEPTPSPKSLDYWVWFPGVGFGDVKLLAMIGAVLGPLGVLQTILAASLAGLALGLAWAVALRRFGAPFGFGPALAAGALLVVLAPDLLPA
jgi:leader peptidase (prepilin peptidase)/N-methyltransferase